MIEKNNNSLSLKSIKPLIYQDNTPNANTVARKCLKYNIYKCIRSGNLIFFFILDKILLEKTDFFLVELLSIILNFKTSNKMELSCKP